MIMDLTSGKNETLVMKPNIPLLKIKCIVIWIRMGNARGNTLSRNHTTLNPNEVDFWKFSWHEMGVYDLPALIDFILARTGQEQLIYAGHSQGGTSLFVLLSERREYNKKISSA